MSRLKLIALLVAGLAVGVLDAAVLTDATARTKAKTLWGPAAMIGYQINATGAVTRKVGCYQPATLPDPFVVAGQGATTWEAAFAKVDLARNGPRTVSGVTTYACQSTVIVVPVPPVTKGVTLAWDPVIAAEVKVFAGYNVYRSDVSGVFTAPPLNAKLIQVTTYTDSTPLTAPTTYYSVKAVALDGTMSQASNQVYTGVTPVVIPPLIAPLGLAASCGTTTFTVKWTAVPGAQSYYLRVDNTGNNTADTWLVNGSDIYVDELAAVTYTAPLVRGAAYLAWVHAANAVEGIGSSSSLNFTCGTFLDDE